jgi:hypothetical protein
MAEGGRAVNLEITLSSAIIVSVVGGIVSITVSIIGGKYLLKSKREERIAKQELNTIRHRLEDMYDIVQRPPDGYEWMVVNKYTHLDLLAVGYTVIDPVRQEEFISDGLCQHLGRTRPQFGKKVAEVARFVNPDDVRAYGRNIEAMIESQQTEQPFTSFEMIKRIRDAKENERRYLVKTVQDGAFILSVYELA